LKITQIYATLKIVRAAGDVSGNRGKGKETTKRTMSSVADNAEEVQKAAR